ncbi:hypothetical protein DE146DRAFT_391109 [Phaeosphaeria sp. MPI-PUGE-AT-0046c]|nr:hypothetical protein DE146DRAFT_391109 [Phaeosphaeria sp. MPI-PUGE-AT-0046c]
MKFTSAAGIATCVALAVFPPSTLAQFDDDYSPNVTLRFFTSSQADSCDYSNSSSALTFTTVSIPVIGHCFNVADLFGGNATSGYVNQSRNIIGSNLDSPGIRWQLKNVDNYDPQANYSSLLYRQHVESASSNLAPGTFADRRITVYGGVNCSELDPTAPKDRKKPLLPWFGLDCRTEAQGRCGDTPYNIASFYVNNKKSGEKGKCWDFAYMGAASGTAASARVVLAALMSVLVAAWVAL